MRIPVHEAHRFWCPFSRVPMPMWDAQGERLVDGELSANRINDEGPLRFPAAAGCLGTGCAAFEPDDHGTLELRDTRKYEDNPEPAAERPTFRWPDTPRNRKYIAEGFYELVAEHPPTGVCGLVAKRID